MKKLIALSVSLLSILTITLLQSCSSTDDNNQLQEPQTVTITHSNIEKKWLTTFYEFTPNVSQATKTAYQVSSVEVSLDNGTYSIYDRYSEKTDKGSYSLDKNLLILTSSVSKETIQFKIEKLTHNEANLTALNHNDITTVEMISIK
ncbi:hypothetical protein [Myroides sp. N17-2]|uniref:hypothetical protein n=1 Tax=Myroides sp. N17-2 TaxID=2030799 RepID=UPI000EFABCD8|nr:hypothetical protein [Myroides sp. N17-2]